MGTDSVPSRFDIHNHIFVRLGLAVRVVWTSIIAITWVFIAIECARAWT